MVSVTFPGGKVSEKDAFLSHFTDGHTEGWQSPILVYSIQEGKARVGIFFFFNSLSQAYAIVFPLTTS